MKKPWIPFWMTPASWGLHGEARNIAEINYNFKYDHYERDLQLARATSTPEELDLALLDVDYDHGVIGNEEEYLRKKIPLTLSPEDAAVELVRLDHECGHLTKHECEKEIASLLNEPWLAVVNDNLDLTEGPNGFYFEFDWNDQWIALLRAHGYVGISDEEIMEKWFSAVCRSEVIQSNPQPFNNSVVYD